MVGTSEEKVFSGDAVGVTRGGVQDERKLGMVAHQ